MLAVSDLTVDESWGVVRVMSGEDGMPQLGMRAGLRNWRGEEGDVWVEVLFEVGGRGVAAACSDGGRPTVVWVHSLFALMVFLLLFFLEFDTPLILYAAIRSVLTRCFGQSACTVQPPLSTSIKVALPRYSSIFLFNPFLTPLRSVIRSRHAPSTPTYADPLRITPLPPSP